MEKIDIQNFNKYYLKNDGNATLARVGHVNAVIEEVNTKITDPENSQNGDVLVYNSTTELWEPGSAGGTDFTYQLGEYVSSEGGVIFHRYKESGQEKYLIVDIANVSGSSAYSDIDNILIGPSAQSTWDGSSNTTAIVNQVGATSGAAFLCDASTNGGQNDWYLPAIDELNLIWNNRFNINKTLSGVGGAGTIGFNIYWSSTESGNNNAWTFNFYSGDASEDFNKGTTYFVRAVRALTI
jgi:hypothetical protein